MPAYKLCSIEGCNKPSRARGWCKMHYERNRQHGSPLTCATTIPPRGEIQSFFEQAIAYAGDECIPWPYSHNQFGYGQITLKGKRYVASRLMCKIAHGPAPSPVHQSAHSCGKGHLGCINKRHLRWDTPKGNHTDMTKHGTLPHSETHVSSKLSNDEVHQIRILIGTRSHQAIADQFGVSRRLIGMIGDGTIWRHLPFS